MRKPFTRKLLKDISSFVSKQLETPDNKLKKIKGLKEPMMRVAFEGCGHGTLHQIYSSVRESANQKGWDGVDLVVIGGDFQAVRNSNDLSCMAVPSKFKEIGDFQEYYRGARDAPYLTVFVGGNHEASNYLSELYYGGWVAPNMYYLGAAGVIRCGPLRIAGMSGIFKRYDYGKPHFERLPYNEDAKRSIYHVRELDVRKLLQIRTQVDLGISHDWPNMAVYHGDHEALVREKPFFEADIATQNLGSPAAQDVLDRLRPSFWFSAHLHCKYMAFIDHDKKIEPANVPSRFPAQPEPAPEPKEEVTAEKEKISAWQQFYQVAAREEKEENQRQLEGQAEHNKRIDSGEISDVSEATYNLTWKKVGVGSDGLDRQVTDVQTNAEVSTQGPAAKNSDEIEIDLDSTSEASANEQMESAPEVVPAPVEDAIPGSNPAAESENRNLTAAAGGESAPKPVPESPEVDTATNPNDLSGIYNKITNFLTLDKCGRRRQFIQLLNFPVVSEPVRSNEQRPYKLQYDKEWLAISRVFADELVVGDNSTPVPPRRSDAEYRKEILAAEEWVEENVVKQGKLTIPKNFSMTAPVYDHSVSVTTSEQPPEYPNPQTEDFCKLIGVENKFHLNSEQLQAQMDAISLYNAEAGRGGGQHNFPNRGRGGRGRGRGGRGGRRGRGNRRGQ